MGWEGVRCGEGSEVWGGREGGVGRGVRCGVGGREVWGGREGGVGWEGGRCGVGGSEVHVCVSCGEGGRDGGREVPV